MDAVDYRQIFYRCKHCGAVNSAHELNSNNHQCYYCGHGDFAPASLRYDRQLDLRVMQKEAEEAIAERGRRDG